MSEIASVCERRYRLSDATCDFERNVKFSEILSMFQDVAVEHATMLNTGFDAMRQRGFFWVLTRVSFSVLRRPRVGETLVVRTFPEPPLPLQCHRVYTIETPRGERLVNGYSMWCVLDLARNRLTAIRNIGLADPAQYVKKDFSAQLDKILPGSCIELAYVKTVRLSDLDANLHMNNVRYADAVLDAFSREEFEHHSVRSVQINYLAQARAGANISVFRSRAEEGTIIVEGKLDGTVPCFIARVQFEERKPI